MRRVSLLVLGVAVIALSAPRASHAQAKDIVETAVGAGTFKTLAMAIAEAGLLDILKGPGPFTVFAPTDDAFAKLPPAALSALLKDKAALKNVLLYHVLGGKVMAADVLKMNGKGARTFEGQDAMIMVMGDKVMLNSANVIKADIIAKNGVIHVIDAVLMPPKK